MNDIQDELKINSAIEEKKIKSPTTVTIATIRGGKKNRSKK